MNVTSNSAHVQNCYQQLNFMDGKVYPSGALTNSGSVKVHPSQIVLNVQAPSP